MADARAASAPQDQSRHYIFAAADVTGIAAASSIDTLLAAAGDIFDVALAGDHELHLLMGMLGIDLAPPVVLPAPADFAALFDYSESLLPVFDPDGYDTFHAEWLRLSGRESTMDEYGHLIFLLGRAGSWNARAARFVLRES